MKHSDSIFSVEQTFPEAHPYPRNVANWSEAAAVQEMTIRLLVAILGTKCRQRPSRSPSPETRFKWSSLHVLTSILCDRVKVWLLAIRQKRGYFTLL